MHQCNGWGLHPYDCWDGDDDPYFEVEGRAKAIDIMSRYYKSEGIRRGAARRLARKWVDYPEHDIMPGKRKGAAARDATRRQRRDRLDRRGRCWRKTGFVTGEAYCGRHGRAAGWPCVR